MLKAHISPTTEADQAFLSDVSKLFAKHLNPDTKERVLALAAQIVGQVVALQDQRTMTPERAMAIIQANIELGNHNALNTLMGPAAGHA